VVLVADPAAGCGRGFGGIQIDPLASAAYAADRYRDGEMNDNESILAELRKIAAWADMQRKITKWSLIFVTVFVPAMIVFSVLMEHRVTKQIEDTAEKPEWYNVDQNVRLGDFDKAIRIGEELILKTPQYPDAHRRLAGAYLAAGKIEKAREHYAEAFRLFPSEENEKLLIAIEKRSKQRVPNQADRAMPVGGRVSVGIRRRDAGGSQLPLVSPCRFCWTA